MTKSALLVVDMQPRFCAADGESVVKAVVRQIRKFRRDDRPIIIVEFPERGPTHWRIIRELSRYMKYRMVLKEHKADGSFECLPMLKEFGITDLDVVGVNTTQCVYETVAGLMRRLPDLRIRVICDGCNDASDGYGKDAKAFKMFPKSTQLELI